MSLAKHWCFTLNNYSQDDELRLQALGPPVVHAVIGREVGESGTPHLQGYLCLSERKRMAFVKRLIGGNPHVEVARNVQASITYCEKDGDFFVVGAPAEQNTGQRTDLEAFKEDVKQGNHDIKSIREIHSEVYAKYTRFCLEYIQDNMPQKALPAHPLREWQQELNGRLNLIADDRTIEFVVDTTGNSGKTWFAHYYSQLHERVQVLQPGKKADMAYALDPTIRVLFIDAPRSKQGEFIQYDFLEDVKNGYVFSSKYESRVKQLERCHVVVLMNELPDMSKLSEDRYKITNL